MKKRKKGKQPYTLNPEDRTPPFRRRTCTEKTGAGTDRLQVKVGTPVLKKDGGGRLSGAVAHTQTADCVRILVCFSCFSCCVVVGCLGWRESAGDVEREEDEEGMSKGSEFSNWLL